MSTQPPSQNPAANERQYFQIFLADPDAYSTWQGIVPSDPGRAVRCISQQATSRVKTKDGDNVADVMPALVVIGDVAELDPSTWTKLVDAGVADALCLNVRDMVSTLHVLPDMPAELVKQATSRVPSACHLPLLALTKASIRFTQPPGSADEKVLLALKKHWFEMMERLWEDPQNMIGDQYYHLMERSSLAQLIVRIIMTDPSFLALIYGDNPRDYTIPVLARMLVHTAVGESRLVWAALASLVSLPDSQLHPAMRPYIKTNPRPSGKILLDQILRGANPAYVNGVHHSELPATVAITPDSYDALLSGLAGVLDRTDVEAHAIGYLDWLHWVSRTGIEAKDEEMVRAFCSSRTLWTSIWTLMRKASFRKSPRILMEAMSLPQELSLSMGTFKSKHVPILVESWVQSGILDMVEVLVTDSQVDLTTIWMPLTMTTTMMGMEGKPSIELLRQQLPRPRLLHSALERAFTMGPPPITAPGKLPPPDSLVWVHGLWGAYMNLESMAVDPKRCGRRGCGTKKAPYTCTACKRTRYCGKECQKLDWRAHKLVCGFDEGKADGDGPTQVTLPDSLTHIKVGERREGQADVDSTLAGLVGKTTLGADDTTLEDLD